MAYRTLYLSLDHRLTAFLRRIGFSELQPCAELMVLMVNAKPGRITLRANEYVENCKCMREEEDSLRLETIGTIEGLLLAAKTSKQTRDMSILERTARAACLQPPRTRYRRGWSQKNVQHGASRPPSGQIQMRASPNMVIKIILTPETPSKHIHRRGKAKHEYPK